MKLVAVARTSTTSRIQAPTADVLLVIGVNVTRMLPTPACIHGAKSEPQTMTASTGMAIAIERCEMRRLTSLGMEFREYCCDESQS
jgi:hypothetical protein